MTTHDKLELPWPEGAVEAYTYWEDAAGDMLSEEPTKMTRPPVPAPPGWCGPEGSDWHDYVGKVLMFWDKDGDKPKPLRFVGSKSRPARLASWESEPYLGRWWRYCRPLTVAEAGVTTP